MPMNLVTFNVALSVNNSPGMHTHDFYEFLLCTNGEGVQYAGTKQMQITRNSFFFMPPGQPHYAVSSNSARLCEVAVIYLSTNVFAPALDGDSDCCLVLDALQAAAKKGRNQVELAESGIEQVKKTIKRMLTELGAKNKGYLLAQKTLMQQLLLTVIRSSPVNLYDFSEVKFNSPEKRIADFVLFLDHNFGQDTSVERAMAMTHLGRSHFHSLFKKVTGSTMVDYVNRRRVAAALELFAEKKMSSAKVMEACGFRSDSHFRYVLRKYAAATPGDLTSAARAKKAGVNL